MGDSRTERLHEIPSSLIQQYLVSEFALRGQLILEAFTFPLPLVGRWRPLSVGYYDELERFTPDNFYQYSTRRTEIQYLICRKSHVGQAFSLTVI